MQYTPVIDSQDISYLYDAILRLETKEDCYRFFEDLCTINEIQAMAQRLQVARMLRDRVTYQQIVDRTGASTATISRINRCLLYGAGGYRAILARMHDGEK
ncbi:MAG: YerC/YecD family TrpR-related protein [Christensenellales bacterium]|jgi:TrpR-related protein YerC/YecD